MLVRRGCLTVKEIQKLLVGREPSEKRAVEAIHSLTEAAKKEASDQTPGHGGRPFRRLLDEGFIEGVTTRDDLDLDDLVLRKVSSIH